MRGDRVDASLLAVVVSLAVFAPVIRQAAAQNATATETTNEETAGDSLPGMVSDQEWSYGDNETNPKMWTKLGYKLCGGKRQSPINIIKKDCSESFHLKNFLRFRGYYAQPRGATAQNTGHTVEVEMDFGDDPDDNPVVMGGDLPGEFSFRQLHFHWGSEHTIDGMRYPLEMHMVHVNNKYDTVEEAKKHPDGIAVLAVLYKTGSKFPSPMVSSLAVIGLAVKTYNGSAMLPAVPLLSLLPVSLGTFYRYSGSLTTPGCDESVVWTVFDTAMDVTEQQIDFFKSVQTSQHESLSFNYRPVQKVNGRKIMHATVPHVGARFADSSTVKSNYLTIAVLAVVARMIFT